MRLDLAGYEAVTGQELWSGIGTDETFSLNNDLNFNTNPEILNTGDISFVTVAPDGSTELQFNVLNPDPALVNAFSDPALDAGTEINFTGFSFAENGPALSPSEFDWHPSIQLGVLKPGPVLVNEALTWYDFYNPAAVHDPEKYQAFMAFAQGAFSDSPVIVNTEVTEHIAMHRAFQAFDTIKNSPELINTFGIADNLMHTGINTITGPIVSYLDADGNQHFLRTTGDDGRSVLQMLNGVRASSIDQILAGSIERNYFEYVPHAEVAEVAGFAFTRAHGRQPGAGTAYNFRVGDARVVDNHNMGIDRPIDPFDNPGINFVPGPERHSVNLTYVVDPKTAVHIAAQVANPDQLDQPIVMDAGQIQALATHHQALTNHADATQTSVELFSSAGATLRYNGNRGTSGNEERISGQYEINSIVTTGAVQNPDGTIELTRRLITLVGDDLPTLVAGHATMAAGLNVRLDEDTRYFLQGSAQLAFAGGLSPEQRENMELLQDPALTVLPGSEEAAKDAARYFANAAVSSAMLELGMVSPEGRVSLGVPLTDPNVHVQVQAVLNEAFGGNVQLGVNASLVNTPDGGLALNFNGNLGVEMNDGNLRLNVSAGTNGITGATNVQGGFQIDF